MHTMKNSRSNPKRSTAASLAFLMGTGLGALALLTAACGSLKDAASDKGENGAEAGTATDAPKAKGSLNLADIQLKSAALLATHSENVFGPGMDIQPGQAQGNNRKGETGPQSVFKVYQNNFGSDAGLKVGDKFGDAPTEAYFMGLAIAGDTIARNCQADVLSKGEESKCYCATEASAKQLLGRAFVQWDFETAERKAFVAKFAAGCKVASTYPATINGMVMSLAYALRR